MLKRNGYSKLALLMFENTTDVESLKVQLTSEYSENDLMSYLQNEDPLVGRAAATALGIVGGMNVVPVLVANLKNEDFRTSLITEAALWNIWSRSGDESVDEMLIVGKKYLADENLLEAVKQFSSVIEASPDFAEGYNQRAIVYYVMERWNNALEDCLQAIELNPHHFGAFAGMGHVYLRLGQIDKAVDAYRKALKINPNLVSIANTLRQLQHVLHEE
ncbi:MAG: tetratricopeptide repeat protein [Candidatus Poribacteria bacterium]|nr:tetratricopeptide repeat protein [Candidatus Poribacteria bacterium]